jgi:hypothetical protein
MTWKIFSSYVTESLIQFPTVDPCFHTLPGRQPSSCVGQLPELTDSTRGRKRRLGQAYQGSVALVGTWGCRVR